MKVYNKILAAITITTVTATTLQAQNKPNGSTQAAAPTGTIATNPSGYSSGVMVNYVRTKEATAPITDINNFNAADYTSVKEATQYIDGLGRPLQTVAKQASPGLKDMVSTNVYDAFGREACKYLPYVDATGTADGKFKLDPFTQQNNFLSSQYQGEQAFYNKTLFEASPLNRPIKTFAAGNSWAGSEGSSTEHAIQMQYLINDATDNVRIWDITNNNLTYSNGDATTNIPTNTNGAYAAGQLYKTVTIDEKGKQVIEYKDKESHVILKKVQIDDNPADAYNGWLCTYYVYDNFGLLRFVMPPKATKYLTANFWLLSPDIISELCFRYEYDARNRMIAKKVPGAGWVYMVYDKRDRLTYTQDANMRNPSFGGAGGGWMVTLYDQLNRPTATGMINYTGNRDQLQTIVDNNFAAAQSTNVTINFAAPDQLSVSERETGKPTYRAITSIEINSGFETENGAETETILGAATTSSNVVLLGYNPFPTNANFIGLTLTFYDDYSYLANGEKPFNTTYTTTTYLPATTNLHPEPIPTSQSLLTKGMVTGVKVRVLENPSNLNAGAWLTTTTYYDDKGRAIQAQSDNYKQGIDMALTRYDFTNKPIATYTKHNNPAASESNRVQTIMQYDYAGRLLQVNKTINDNANSTRAITRNSYDELGQLKNKQLGQKALGDMTPLEQLAYDYNIRGWLQGINRDYSRGNNNTSWFGMELNYDWGFSSPLGGAGGGSQYNGNIAGTQWRSKGDGERRAFGYDYDNANRILKADFTQYTSTAWNTNAGLDFSMKMGDGSTHSTAYDENGNIKALWQKGFKGLSSITIDDLSYSYNTNSNKLGSVTDAVTGDNKLGDFTDNNTSGDDYTYDANGNMVQDKNKAISSIIYNHLNLPYQITVAAKGTITYIYDAAGNKLEKRTVDNTISPTKNTTTDYIAGYVYENNALQFMGMEEGRFRKLPNSPFGGWGADYFIKDHLGNTRMVLTDEQKQETYPVASLEDGAVNTEQSYYEINTGNIVDKSSVPSFSNATNNNYQNNNGNPPYNTNPNSNTNAISNKLYKLNGATGSKTGLGITLKVMSGDNVNIFGKSYWHSNGTTPNNNYNIVINNLLAALAGTNVVAGSGKGITATALQNSTATSGSVGSWLSQIPPSGGGGAPKAAINWILFDEQFKVITANSGFDMVDIAEQVKTHQKTVSISKNGYLYVYCSNESNQDVFFDNLQVVHNHGPLTEEDHYYPFGLTMQGISSRAANSLENRKKFNGNELQSKEFSDGSGLELYDFNVRTYDQQVGRFIQIDPTPEDGEQETLTPYHFSGNNPSTFNDPNGKCPWCWGAIIGAAVEYGTQVAGNLAQGKSLGESLTDVDGGAILISAGAGALSAGASAFVPKGAAAKVVKEVVVTTIDAGESMAKQYNETGSVSLKKTVTDVVANKIGGKLTENVKVNSSSAIKTTEKQLNRAERVAAGDATSSGRAATVKKLETKVSSMNAANKRVQQTAVGAVSNTLQAGADAVGNSGSDKKKVVLPAYDINKPAVDNTAVKKILPIRF